MRYAHSSGKVYGKRFEPNGGKVTVNCSTCDKPFQIWRYLLRFEKHFCSKECRSVGRREPKGAQVTLICAWCKKVYIKRRGQIIQNERRRTTAKQSYPYCSPECQAKGLMYLYSPDERSGYVDGRSLDNLYHPPVGWKEFSRKIKQRDHFACRLCGSTKKLVVHHIDHDRENNDLSNLITLCSSCNVKERWHRIIYEPIIRQLMPVISGS